MSDVFNRERQNPSRSFILDLYSLLLSVRNSLESFYTRRKQLEDADRVRALLLAIESARIPLRLVTRRSEDSDAYRETLTKLLGELRDLIKNPELREMGNIRFRPISERDPPSRNLLDQKMFEDRTILSVVSWMIERLEAELGLARDESAEIQFVDLIKIIPAQKIAPVQFQIRGGRLAILHVPRAPAGEDDASVASAKAELVASGEKVLSELQRSNCDRRLIETVQYLQEQLVSERDVIRLGLSNIACEIMCAQFQGELPDAVSAMLQAHTRGVELYAAQYPDWNRFLQNASASVVTSTDVQAIRQTADDVVSTLIRQPELAEPEVPKTISLLNELLKNPGASAKRAAFAMLRTLENLISKVFGYAAEVADKTVLKSINTISTVASKAVMVALLTMALNSSIALQPVAGKIIEMQWLRNATEIVQKQIDQMSK